jgi:hypothetical protein
VGGRLHAGQQPVARHHLHKLLPLRLHPHALCVYCREVRSCAYSGLWSCAWAWHMPGAPCTAPAPTPTMGPRWRHARIELAHCVHGLDAYKALLAAGYWLLPSSNRTAAAQD